VTYINTYRGRGPAMKPDH